jgi:hypothetical protein
MASVQSTPRRVLSPSQGDEAAVRYTAGESMPQIAASFGFCAETIGRALHRRGIAGRSQTEVQAKHPLRHDAFDDLTPDAAYWCGFLFADGSICERPGRAPTVALTLTEADRPHLEKLRTFLGSAHAITYVKGRSTRGYNTKPSYRFAVRSSQLAHRLRALGRYDGPVDSRLAQSRDFWRGVMDGDGHVGLHVGQAQVRLCGSHRLLSAYTDFVARTRATPGSRPLTVRPHKSIYQVSATCATAERIAGLLYTEAATALDRKAVAAELIRQHSVQQDSARRRPGYY